MSSLSLVTRVSAAAMLFTASFASGAAVAANAPDDGPVDELSVELQKEAIAAAQSYCRNTAAEASDARLAWQMRALFNVETRMQEKIVELDEKIEELRKWVEMRDDILKRSEGHVVQIYANMRAEAAAEQLLTLDDKTAVSILLQMKPRQAGAILAEMTSDRAAYLTDSMALLTERKRKEGNS